MKATIDETGQKVQLIFNGRWVEIELPYSLYDMAALALRQMKPKEPGDEIKPIHKRVLSFSGGLL
jgi:hypothetical protein